MECWSAGVVGSNPSLHYSIIPIFQLLRPEEIFDVSVTHVNISKVPPKPKRRGVHAGQRPGWKKAVVTIAEGQSIEAFGPGV